MNKHLSTLALIIGLLACGSAIADQDSSKKSSPGTLIVDAMGKVVGNLLYSNMVEIQINGTWYGAIGVVRDGIATSSEQDFGFGYTSTNCSGTAYMATQSLPILAYAINPANPNNEGGNAPTVVIYYPAPPFQSLTIFSVQQGGQCFNGHGGVNVFGAAATMTLTVVPPLSVQ